MRFFGYEIGFKVKKIDAQSVHAELTVFDDSESDPYRTDLEIYISDNDLSSHVIEVCVSENRFMSFDIREFMAHYRLYRRNERALARKARKREREEACSKGNVCQ